MPDYVLVPDGEPETPKPIPPGPPELNLDLTRDKFGVLLRALDQAQAPGRAEVGRLIGALLVQARRDRDRLAFLFNYDGRLLLQRRLDVDYPIIYAERAIEIRSVQDIDALMAQRKAELDEEQFYWKMWRSARFADLVLPPTTG